MHTSFSIQRFGLLLKSDIVRNYKNILSMLTLMTGLYLFSALFSGINGLYTVKTSFLGTIGIIVFLVPFIFYKNLFHPIKGVSYSMLPASQTEKFASAFTLCVILVPLALLLFAWILTLIGAGLTGYPDLILDLPGTFSQSTISVHLGFFNSFFWGCIATQSISIWGIFFFKTRKIGKTILTLCCIGILLSILGITGFRIMLGYYASGVETIIASSTERFARILSIFFSILLPFILWGWACFKMRRQQF